MGSGEGDWETCRAAAHRRKRTIAPESHANFCKARDLEEYLCIGFINKRGS